jgi:hypothetical protein
MSAESELRLLAETIQSCRDCQLHQARWRLGEGRLTPP